MKASKKKKFPFGVDFQQSILQFSVTDKQGYKAIELFNEDYFTLLEHSIIAHVLKRYYKLKRSIPSKVILREKLRALFRTKEYHTHYAT